MANIKEELRRIKNAIFGREVRGSIHDGIKKMNDEVEVSTKNQMKHTKLWKISCKKDLTMLHLNLILNRS